MAPNEGGRLMALLFYETEYKPERSQAEIQKLLRQMGARRLTVEFGQDGDTTVGMSFTLQTPVGEREFLLPARVERVREVLERQGVLKRRSDKGNSHATMVAWRTLLEWVKVQAAMAETHQAKPDEIMLPYLVLAGARPGEAQTLYEQFSSDRALPGAKR